MTVLIVGLGGVAGGISRFLLGRLITRKSRSAFPWGTLAINLSGAVLLGVLTGANPPRTVYSLLGDGFLGAYTTFSTFMYEDFLLFQNRKRRSAAVYILGSAIAGTAGYILGFWAVRTLPL